MFDGLQIFSNTTKNDQTRSNSTKQGGQTVKCLVTKQCSMVFGDFGRQTFPVWTGLKYRRIFVYNICLITISDTVSDVATKRLILNIERATHD